MGADIHIYAERKLKDGTWAMCKSYEGQSSRQFRGPAEQDAAMYFPRVRSRNYNFFAALAGVRGDGPDWKGFPEDASPLVREEFERWAADAHSPSFYTAREFVPIFMDHWMSESETAELVSNRMDHEHSLYDITYNVLDGYLGIDVPYTQDTDEPDVDAIRFVFWFDN